MTPAQAADWAAYLDEHRDELLELFAGKFPELADAIARAEAEPCGPGCRCTALEARSDPNTRETARKSL